MDTTPYSDFAIKVIGHKFNDLGLLITAFTHRSYVNEHRKSVSAHNERLEFLGDAVLELVVTNFLYTNYDEPEGILTNWRSALVRTESISAAASKLEFMELMRLSKGEKRGSDRAKEQILANAFEAVIGAVFLDLGYDVAKQFIEVNINQTLEKILTAGTWLDSKSKFQEQVQAKDLATPSYMVLSEEGPDHDKAFVVGVYVGSEMYGKGSGSSKQAAQQAAARNGLKKLK